MKSLTGLYTSLLLECGRLSDVNTDMDRKTVHGRSEHEGFSFFTITLPAFGQDFDVSLDRGRVDSDLFAGFARSGGLPRFLSGFLRRVFDQHTGVLLDRPCVESIRSIRQLCYLLKKIELPCSPARQAKAIERYISTEMELKQVEATISEA